MKRLTRRVRGTASGTPRMLGECGRGGVQVEGGTPFLCLLTAFAFSLPSSHHFVLTSLHSFLCAGEGRSSPLCYTVSMAIESLNLCLHELDTEPRRLLETDLLLTKQTDASRGCSRA
jgi:hypothetical protein